MNRWSLIAAVVLAGMFAGCAGFQMGDPDEYTIRLAAFSGTDHVQTAQHFKEGTEQQAGWSGLYVVTKNNVSELYWGKYPTMDAAKPDLERAHAWKTKYGVQLYPLAIVARTPGKDIGPPDWNLAKAKGTYTVLIATFFDVPEAKYVGRRGFAVEYCKYLRGLNEPAYYYHGDSQSIVAIGLFDEGAIVDVKENAGTVTEKRVKDQRINDILRKHPYLGQNGLERVEVLVPDITSTKAKSIFKPSYVIRIPRDENGESPMFNSRGELITQSEPATQPQTQPR